MSTANVSRVHYFEKQFLRLDEFRDEQQYQLALRRRHNITQHTWGIVSGLELAIEDGAAVIHPGIAIDGYGRELLLETKATIAPETFDDLATDRLDIWLVYGRSGEGDTPDGYGECAATDGQSYRDDEIPLILAERPISNKVDARTPPGVPANVLDAVPPPTSDDPADTWRVYLGRFIRLPGATITADMSWRVYAGVVAETIDHPANAARVEIGMRSAAAVSRVVGGVTYSYEQGDKDAPKQSRRFAVFVPEDASETPSGQPVALAPRLEIDSEGDIRLRGQTIVNGNLRLSAGAVRFVNPADFTADNAPDEPSIYRFSAPDGKDQLRIDLGSGQTANRVLVIGFSTADGSFNERVRVELQDASGKGDDLVALVTITGDLTVGGKITAGAVEPPILSNEARAAILGSFQAGFAAGNTGG
jgi:hypothetical protein